MIKQNNEKAVLVATLNDEQLVIITREEYLSSLKGYIEDMTTEYEEIGTQQTLKEFIVECLNGLEDEEFEILRSSDTTKEFAYKDEGE